MTITSYRLNDVSQGLVAVPLWIPPSGMALGLVTLFVATTDDLVVPYAAAAPPTTPPGRAKTAAVPGFER